MGYVYYFIDLAMNYQELSVVFYYLLFVIEVLLYYIAQASY